MLITNIFSIISLFFIALTFWTQQRTKKREVASKFGVWFNEVVDEPVTGKCIISNKNDFPMYNVFVFIVPNNFSDKSAKKIFNYVAQTNKDRYINNEELEKSLKNEHDSALRQSTIDQINREADYKTLAYFEVFAPGKKTFLFDNNYSAGHTHRVPGMFFTDNQNMEWLRFPDGSLQRKRYIKEARKQAILFNHV